VLSHRKVSLSRKSGAFYLMAFRKRLSIRLIVTYWHLTGCLTQQLAASKFNYKSEIGVALRRVQKAL